MSTEIIEVLHRVIEWCAIGIEVFAVSVIVGGVVLLAVTRGTLRYLFQLKKAGAYESYKRELGRPLLMGLTLLVAADVIRTVALELTPMNVAVLGLLVVVRTMLSWTLDLEMEGRWPWQAKTHDETLDSPTKLSSQGARSGAAASP